MTSPKSSGPPKKRPRAPFAIRRVVGDSMLPTLKPGQLVLVRQWFVTPHPGQVIVIKHNGIEKIKRVGDIRYDGVYLLGDNPGSSTDSRTIGWLSTRLLVGAVILLP